MKQNDAKCAGFTEISQSKNLKDETPCSKFNFQKEGKQIPFFFLWM